MLLCCFGLDCSPRLGVNYHGPCLSLRSLPSGCRRALHMKGPLTSCNCVMGMDTKQIWWMGHWASACVICLAVEVMENTVKCKEEWGIYGLEKMVLLLLQKSSKSPRQQHRFGPDPAHIWHVWSPCEPNLGWHWMLSAIKVQLTIFNIKTIHCQMWIK